MLEQLLKYPDFMNYVLAAEILLLCILQLRTNGLLRKSLRLRAQKKETVRALKEEVKKGDSSIPVVKFEKPKVSSGENKNAEKTGAMDQKELAVLQEMMTEFFG